jgi:hypothetical protein
MFYNRSNYSSFLKGEAGDPFLLLRLQGVQNILPGIEDGTI